MASEQERQILRIYADKGLSAADKRSRIQELSRAVPDELPPRTEEPAAAPALPSIENTASKLAAQIGAAPPDRSHVAPSAFDAMDAESTRALSEGTVQPHATGTAQSAAPMGPAPMDPSGLKFAGAGGAGGFGGLPTTPVRQSVVGTDTYQPVQQSINRGRPLNPEIEARRTEIETAQQDNARDAFGAAEYRARSLAVAEQQAQEQQSAIAQEQERVERERQAALRQKESEWMDAMKDATDTRIDPNEFWDSQSFGSKMGRTISVIFGALAARGGPNQNWNQLRQEIDANIDAQKANKESKFRAAEGKRTFVDMARARYQSEAAIDAAAREAAYSNISARLQRFSDFAKTPERKAALEAMLLASQQAVNEARDLRMAAAQDEVSEVMRFDPKRVVTTGGGTDLRSLKQAIEQRNALRELGVIKDPDDPLLVPGFGRGRTEKEAQAARELIGAADSSRAKLNKLRQFIRDKGASVKGGAMGMGTDDYKAAQAMYEGVLPDLAKIASGGFNPTETNEKQATRMIPTPDTILGRNTEQSIGIFLDGLDDMVSAKIRPIVSGAPERPKGGRAAD